MKALQFVPALLVPVAIAACNVDRPAPMAPPAALEARQPSRATLDRYLVEYSGDSGKLAAAVRAAGGHVGRIHESIGVLEVEGMDAGAILALPGAQHATPDITVHLMKDMTPIPVDGLPIAVSAFELDPPPAPAADATAAYFYDCQWDLQQIHAQEAWALGARGAGMKIALLDTGVDEDHVDLEGKVDLAESVSMVTWHDDNCPAGDESTITDYNSHGTGNAAEIASNNIGVASVAPDAQTVMVKVMTCTGDGSLADVLAGLLYAADLEDVNIISMSLMGPMKRGAPGTDRFIAMFQKGVNYATQQGKLLVGTAGNDGVNLTRQKDWAFIPTSLANVKSAYATDHLDHLATYSNYGVSDTWVGGPGGQQWADYDGEPLAGCPIQPALQNRLIRACSGHTVLANGYNFPWDACGSGGNAMYIVAGWGTSYATPEVAAVAALVLGMHGGGLNPQQLANILAQTADDLGTPGVDEQYGHGRVNAGRAVQHR